MDSAFSGNPRDGRCIENVVGHQFHRSIKVEDRRRAVRCNGTVLYVARMLKGGGTGPAAPCDRCLHWCVWAGVKRIFHWDGDSRQWVRVHVGEAAREGGYSTAADTRLAAGLVSLSLYPLQSDTNNASGMVKSFDYQIRQLCTWP